MRKVVITGMGVISPLGLTLEEYWNSLVQGKSGVDEIQMKSLIVLRWRDCQV